MFNVSRLNLLQGLTSGKKTMVHQHKVTVVQYAMRDHTNGTSRAIIMANKSIANNGKPMIVMTNHK
jgi:hypothetical protein